MRPLALLLVAVLARASDEEVVLHALAALRRGDPLPLAGLPATSIDLPDPADPDLRRRWSAWLPGLIAALPAADRDRALAILAARVHNDADAIDALPTPAAAQRLAAAADRAFDRGRFAEARLLWRRLAATGAPVPADRQRLASLLAGDEAEADADPAIPAPAGTASLPAMPVPTAGATARAEGAWLVADDPWGRPWWRRRRAAADRVVAGGDWAVLLGPEGLRAIDAEGRRHDLPPAPAGTWVAGTGGGGAVLLRDRPPVWRGRDAGAAPQTWRCDLATATVDPLSLVEEPLGPPLLRGVDSLWLGRLHLWRSRPGRPPESCRHGLDLAPGAHLAWSGRRPVVLDGARAWLVLHDSALAPAAAADPLIWRRAEPAADALTASVRREGLWLVVEAADRAGPRWRRRWAARDEHAAPSQLAVVADGRVTVLEGAGDLTSLDAADGTLIGWGLIAGAAIDPERAFAWGPHRAAAAQLGRPDRLLVAVDGDERRIDLGSPLRGLRAPSGDLEVDTGTGWLRYR